MNPASPPPVPSRHREFTVPPEGEGERLDRWLAGALDLSRTRVARLVEEGRVRWNASEPRKSEPLSPGDRIEVEIPPPVRLDAVAEDLPLDIVYQDAHLAVVNKAAGMVVHPAPGHPTGTLVNALLHHVQDLAGIGGTLRPGIVHRLDQDTSGLLVVAKDDVTHQALSAAPRRRKVRRLYLAATWGHLPESPLRIDAPMARSPRDRKRMAVVEQGRRAVTHARVLERWAAAELLEVSLETGRTHQIRVHLAHRGHPVVGDRVYGSGWARGMGGPAREWAQELERRVPRQFLHAYRLAFRHPATGEVVRFEAPLPGDLARTSAWARGEEP
jgi:23S rRNA pseudouridine1911/1915/1917 synthase